MDHRMPLSATTTRPLPNQRAVSGSALYFSKPATRPALPSHLSSVRSASHSAVVDLTEEGAVPTRRNYGPSVGKKEQLVQSPSVIAVDDDEEEEERPAKRLKVNGKLRGSSSQAGFDNGMAYVKVPGERLPGLPKPHVVNTKAAPVRDRQHDGESAGRKMNGLEAPAIATQLPPPKNVADFHPWTGHHPEDVLNENVVKMGYSDKPPNSIQTECNSAKPSIWPNLSTKNSAGLQMLGYLFTQVMEKRQTLGKCTAPSTFKPPPRVTVTDTKREAWLRDLANPDVPLRKQSRTIPHGIRGKLLMDQCLSKDIPLQRAVWLAKCVGANELRAFRRKGINGLAAATGESKWVREWTVNVEQFLEGVIASCGEQQWQAKMDYAVKLAVAFYTEQLLDKDHYLDWIVSSFRETSNERLPVWIVVLQAYWKDIVQFVQRGRKLGLAILDHLQVLSDDPYGVNTVLSGRLQKLVAVLAVTSRGCLVIPGTWEKYNHVLEPAALASVNESLRGVAQSLSTRNKRLVDPIRRTPLNTRSPKLRLYDMLDTAGLNIDHVALSTSCLVTISNVAELIPALLDWASSPYRQGLARLYLAARIVSTLRSEDHDTDSVILSYISQISKRPALQHDNIYRLIAELVRNDALLVGPYLRWLVSSGALHDKSSSQIARNMLAAIPGDSLPSHVEGLRRTLLSRMDYADEVELLAAPIRKAFDLAWDEGGEDQIASLFTDTSLAVKILVADHARTVLSRMNSIDLGQFQLLRSVLEAAGDLAAVADLSKAALLSDDAAVLATVADTITWHADVLAAMGRLSSMTESILDRYRVLRSQQPLDRTFILALMRFASLLCQQEPSEALLRSDLLICEQLNIAAVCSPASDNLISMQATSLESEQDIDAVFASGNTMDDQLLQRVLMRVLQRTGRQNPKLLAQSSKVCEWLAQLRVVGGNSFDELVGAYIRSAFATSPDALKPAEAIIALVTSGCISLADVINVVNSSSEGYALSLALQLLLGSMATSTGSTLAEQCRYRAIQRLHCIQDAEHVVPLLMAACELPDLDITTEALLDLIMFYTTTQTEVVRYTFRGAYHAKPPTPKAVELARALVARGLDPTDSGDLDMHRMVTVANPLSVRFCAGALTYLARDSRTAADTRDELVKGLIIEAIQSGNDVWPQLLGTTVNNTTKRALHSWAQNRVLFGTTKATAGHDTAAMGLVERYLDVMDLTYHSFSAEDDTHILALLNDKLRGVEQRLGGKTEDSLVDDGYPVWRELNVLLHICCLHVRPSTTPTEVNMQARATLFMSLCAMLSQPRVLVDLGLADYIFDLASTLGDSLSETTVARVAQMFKPTDPRFQSLFGQLPNTSPDAWLALASQASSNPQGRGTAQQRALAKHAAGSSGSATPAARPGIVGASTFISGQPQQRPWSQNAANRAPTELMKTTTFTLKRWEVMPDAAPMLGENDTSLSLGLFGARKV
ncbi:hypothetical protein LTR62_002234 [Meristemomyces frigidus]|uniref:Mediator of RNA polymerase II transcription subunit 12 n=1 Tax=Meristemomyces frigidus TaxID=1508187 RepID=A0AAN7TFT5_9PEZI|nr:hypothetical protein LTR62_002234 [Meristemomyces frigidus]